MVPVDALSQNARAIAQAAFPSVVLIALEDANGQPVSLGSGFFVRENILATNLHVIEGASRGYVKLVGKAPRYKIDGVVAVDARRDLALLSAPGASAPALRLGDSSRVAVGDPVFAIGNPQGLEGTLSQGIVSGIRTFESDSLLQITAPISPCSSGGPILDANGAVIALALGLFREGQNLNFAIPSMYIERLLTNIGAPGPFPKSTSRRDSPTLKDQLGRKTTDGVVAVHFAWDSPIGAYSAFSFSLRNELQRSVSDINWVVIFYDSADKPVHSQSSSSRPPGWVRLAIGPGLAIRVQGHHVVHGSVQPLTKRVEIRILDFKVANE